MAVIGQALTAPEAGWKRYDDTHLTLKKKGSESYANTPYYGGSRTQFETNGTIEFDFIGTKVILLSSVYDNYTGNIEISIDGILLETREQKSSTVGIANSLDNNQIVWYMKEGLENARHKVKLRNTGTGKGTLDAIDIDSNGRLLHPDEVTDPKDLNIGKRIRCHYKATANAVGTFSNLGQETYVDGINDFTPPASSATPSGSFYYICVDKDHLGRWKLIADRNIQHSISWNTMNSAGIASSGGLPNKEFFWNNFKLDKTKATANNVSQPAQNAFDSDNSTSWSTGTTSPTVSEPIWLQYEFDKPTIVQGYKITSDGDSPGDWKFQGSNTGGSTATDWIDLYSYVGNSTSIGTLLHEIDNNNAFRYYRFLITKKYGTSGVVVTEIAFLSKVVNLEDFYFTTRLLTGGVSATDKDNEWNKYIVDSNLGGAITAGDNGVWNFSDLELSVNYASWTSTTSTTNSSRVIRGGSSSNGGVSRHGQVSSLSTVSANTGFRPVLLIEEIIILLNKSFILLNGEYKKFDNDWQTISTTLPSIDTFKSEGMDDLSAFDRKETKFIVPMDNNTLQGEVLGEGKVFRETVDTKRFFDLISIDVISK